MLFIISLYCIMYCMCSYQKWLFFICFFFIFLTSVLFWPFISPSHFFILSLYFTCLINWKCVQWWTYWVWLHDTSLCFLYIYSILHVTVLKIVLLVTAFDFLWLIKQITTGFIFRNMLSINVLVSVKLLSTLNSKENLSK